MFQEAALFPWLSVERNVELPLKLRKVPRGERRDRVAELLELVQLTAFAGRQPHELSGGMRQRVALARALARDAEVLLMDEPFGALDAMTRDILHDELERIWQATGCTILFVTHNVREAARLGDRIVLLTSRPGRVAEEFRVDIPRPRRIEDPDVAALAGRRHRPTARGGRPPWPVTSGRDAARGLARGGRRPRRARDAAVEPRVVRSRRAWASAWPKAHGRRDRARSCGRPSWRPAAGADYLLPAPCRRARPALGGPRRRRSSGGPSRPRCAAPSGASGSPSSSAW